MKHSLIVILCVVGFSASVRAESILKGINMDRPSVGGKFLNIAEAKIFLKENKLPPPRAKNGIMFYDIFPGSPLEKAKFTFGDMITVFDGQRIDSVKKFGELLGAAKVGKPIKVGGYRLVRGKQRPGWKRGTVKITPVRLRDVYLGAVMAETDEFKGVTFYTHKNTPEPNKTSDVNLYFNAGSDGKPRGLRLRIQHVTESQFLSTQFAIRADDTRFKLDPGFFNIKREFGLERCAEWGDVTVDKKLFNGLKAMIKARTVRIRHQSSKSVIDRDLSSAEIERLRTVMYVYELKGGKWPTK